MTGGPLSDEVCLSNGVVEVRIARAYGPRVTAFRFAGGPNVFGAAPHATRATPDGVWRAYGGHRVWAAPESFPLTYTLDDTPPSIEADRRRAVARRAADPHALVAVEIELELGEQSSDVAVTHRLRNNGMHDMTIAPWGITIVQPGGVAVVPNSERRPQPSALRPARPIVVWHYTALDDERLRFGAHAATVRCVPAQQAPFKIGFGNERGWFAYLWERTAFVVTSSYDREATYPDFGCSTEIYTEGAFCEVETLGPLVRLTPGDTAEHTETWRLLADVDDVASLLERMSAAAS